MLIRNDRRHTGECDYREGCRDPYERVGAAQRAAAANDAVVSASERREQIAKVTLPAERNRLARQGRCSMLDAAGADNAMGTTQRGHRRALQKPAGRHSSPELGNSESAQPGALNIYAVGAFAASPTIVQAQRCFRQLCQTQRLLWPSADGSP